MPKILLFHVTESKNEVLSVIEVPSFKLSWNSKGPILLSIYPYTHFPCSKETFGSNAKDLWIPIEYCIFSDRIN